MLPDLCFPPARVGVEQIRLAFLLRTCGEGRPDFTPISLGRLAGVDFLAPSIDCVRALPAMRTESYFIMIISVI